MSGKRKKSVKFQSNSSTKYEGFWKKLVKWLIGLSTLPFASIVYDFLVGPTVLGYIGPLKSGYEFQFTNDTPIDEVVKDFRVIFPDQRVLFVTTKAFYASRDNKGRVILPWVDNSSVPASEFKGIDGQVLLANKKTKFRIPPLIGKDGLEPKAVYVQIQFEVIPKNLILAKINSALIVLRLRSEKHNINYVVIDNYWVITRSKSPTEAIKTACKENDLLKNQPFCKSFS